MIHDPFAALNYNPWIADALVAFVGLILAAMAIDIATMRPRL